MGFLNFGFSIRHDVTDVAPSMSLGSLHSSRLRVRIVLQSTGKSLRALTSLCWTK